jgi:Xaa-Pro aminopeptidase
VPGLLLFGDTERNAALRHELPLAIIDPLMFVELDGRCHILTSRIERDRIARVRPDAELLEFFDFGFRELREAGMERGEAMRETAVRAVQQIGLGAAVVPSDLPFALGERLRAAGVELKVDDAAVDGRRRAKSPAELEGVRLAQQAAMAGMGAARELVRRSRPDADGHARLDGEPLLAEDVRAAIRAACADAGAPCPPDVMVSSAWAGFGHDPGYGPLPAGLPIVVDLWPRHEESACWGDMTRTFVVGEPRPEVADELAEMERLVAAAFADTIASLRPGIAGRELYAKVCDRFEAAGWPTQRTAESGGGNDGFQFALGHGVGLEIHEAPYLGLAGAEQLVAGDVIAVEPGLHRDGLGMVRFEDLLLITESGAENLTDFPYELV